jgi:predicted HNH restriction endonuclease
MDKPIPLELHHITGINNDHRLENLQMLCPNCHAFTDNYRGKNTGMSAQEEILDVEQP